MWKSGWEMEHEVPHAKELELYGEGTGELMKGYRQGNAMTRSAF